MDALISRQAAIDALRVAYWDDNIQSAKDDPCIVDAMTDWAIRQVKALPSAQTERPKGEWIHIRDEEDGNALYECSVCHKGEVHVPIVEVSYCWNCGADMRGEQDG